MFPGAILWSCHLGDVVAQMDEKPGIQITEIDLDRVDAIREQLPLLIRTENGSV